MEHVAIINVVATISMLCIMPITAKYSWGFGMKYLSFILKHPVIFFVLSLCSAGLVTYGLVATIATFGFIKTALFYVAVAILGTAMNLLALRNMVNAIEEEE